MKTTKLKDRLNSANVGSWDEELTDLLLGEKTEEEYDLESIHLKETISLLRSIKTAENFIAVVEYTKPKITDYGKIKPAEFFFSVWGPDDKVWAEYSVTYDKSTIRAEGISPDGDLITFRNKEEQHRILEILKKYAKKKEHSFEGIFYPDGRKKSNKKSESKNSNITEVCLGEMLKCGIDKDDIHKLMAKQHKRVRRDVDKEFLRNWLLYSLIRGYFLRDEEDSEYVDFNEIPNKIIGGVYKHLLGELL